MVTKKIPAINSTKRLMPNDYYFFSLSYSNIPAILSIIEKIDKLNSISSNIHIIVHIESHSLFWQQLIRFHNLEWQVIFLDTNVAESLKNPLSWLKIRQSIKRTFKTHFQDLRDAQIYFFSLSPPLQVLALIKLLARNNRVYFLDCDRRTYPKWHNLINTVYRLLVRLSYGVDIELVRVGDSALSFLAEGFIKKAKVQQLACQHYYDVRILKKYDFVDSEIKAGKRIVLLDDDCYLYEPPSSREAYKMLKTLRKVIESNFSKSEVLFKRHPNPMFHTKDFGSIYGDYLEYPYYIPADFIFLGPNIELIIGGFSTTLAIAARHFNIRSISYLKLVPFQNEGFKAHIIETLMSESDNKIAFPDSWQELNSLLSCSAHKLG